MAETPEETIIEAATAYRNGQEEPLRRQLHGAVRIHGSHRNDRWEDLVSAMGGLSNELGRHRSREEQSRPDGSLVRNALAPRLSDDQKTDYMAWWTTRGSLTIDGTDISDASWTVVLTCIDDDWQIVHSHFSIHHVPDGRHPQAESTTA